MLQSDTWNKECDFFYFVQSLSPDSYRGERGYARWFAMSCSGGVFPRAPMNLLKVEAQIWYYSNFMRQCLLKAEFTSLRSWYIQPVLTLRRFSIMTTLPDKTQDAVNGEEVASTTIPPADGTPPKRNACIPSFVHSIINSASKVIL